jgi:hypothetical protein
LTQRKEKSLNTVEKKTLFYSKTLFFYYFCIKIIYEMNRFIYIFLSAIILFSACSGKKGDEEKLRYESIDTVPLLIMQIQKCSRLYTTEFQVHKIVTHSDILKVQGTIFDKHVNLPLPLGDRKVAIPMDATLKGYIDFADFSEQNVSREADRITITLPNPKVMLTATKVDQENMRQYVSLMRSNFSDAELSSFEQQGREAIIQSIPTLGIIETARESAAKVLIPLLVQMGFQEQNITIAFDDEVADPTNIRALLDLTQIEK